MMITSAPAWAKSLMYCAGLLIIRCASSGISVQRRTASTTSGPMVILGTKWPSIMSIWMRAAPASVAARTCSPSRVKSAERIDGTIPTILSSCMICVSQLRGGGAIEHPGHFAVWGAHDLGGIFVRLVGAFDDGVDCRRFFGPGDEEEDVAGRVEQGRREGQPVGRRLRHADGHDQPIGDVEGWLVWEKRGGMAFRTHAKLDQVEGRDAVGAEDALHLPRIRLRGGLAVWLVGRHTMDVGGRNGNFAQQHLLGHVVIALRVGGRHAAFVRPEDLDGVPVDLFAVRVGGEQVVGGFWRVAAGQGERKAAMRDNGLVGETHNISGSLVVQGVITGEDINIHQHTLLITDNAVRIVPVSCRATAKHLRLIAACNMPGCFPFAPLRAKG